ncbi:MAG TPA: Gfo/Idh/MocA family oxidoreductase [Gemmatimonadaceae bacterium]
MIGAGALGYHHVRILRDLPGVEFSGFHDTNGERAALVARELSVRSFDTAGELIDACDALTVVVPTRSHYTVARDALIRGRHLLIEKPLTATLAEADELLQIADRNGLLVQTGHVERFNRAIRGAQPFVEEPRFVESDRLAPFSPRGADVAVVLDLMIHDIDLILTLVGERVDTVSAVGIPVLTSFVDIANARLTFSSGAVANITASRVSRERMRKLRIFQQSGYLSLDLASGEGEFYRLRKGLDLAELARGPLAIEAFVERVPIDAAEGEPLRLEFESFVAAVQGRRAVTVTGHAGRDALEVALRIQVEIERALRATLHRDGAKGA